MSLSIITTGVCHTGVLNGTPAAISIGNMIGVWVTADVDCHIRVDGANASTSDMIIWAKERVSIVVDGVPNAQGTTRKVSIVKATGAADGTYYIVEAC